MTDDWWNIKILWPECRCLCTGYDFGEFQWYTGTFSVCIAWKQRIGFWLRIRKGYKKIWRSEFTEKISHRRKVTSWWLLYIPKWNIYAADAICGEEYFYKKIKLFMTKQNRKMDRKPRDDVKYLKNQSFKI